MSHPSRTFRSRKGVTCSLETTLRRPSPHTGASPQGHPVPWCLRIKTPTQAAVTNVVTSDSAGKTKVHGNGVSLPSPPFLPAAGTPPDRCDCGLEPSPRQAGALGPRRHPGPHRPSRRPLVQAPVFRKDPHSRITRGSLSWEGGGRAPRSLWPRPSGPDAPQTRAQEAHRTPRPLARSWVWSWVGDLVPTSAQKGPGCRLTWAPSVSGRARVGAVWCWEAEGAGGQGHRRDPGPPPGLWHLQPGGAQIFLGEPIMTFDTKLTMALAGCSGSCSANRWHTLSEVLPCFRATNPKALQREAVRASWAGGRGREDQGSASCHHLRSLRGDHPGAAPRRRTSAPCS